MSESDGRDGDDGSFEVFSGAESAADRPEYENTNVLRVAGLATLFYDPNPADVARELTALGFNESMAYQNAWQGFDAHRMRAEYVHPGERSDLWDEFRSDGHPDTANAFLIGVLGSDRERESVAAAAVLWQPEKDPVGRVRLRVRQAAPWLGTVLPPRKRQWSETYEAAMTRGDIDVVRALSRVRLERGLSSPDQLVRSFASAALLRTAYDRTPVEPAVAAPPVVPTVVSTMVHGTMAFKGDWWGPSGDFFDYVLGGLRRDLYKEGGRYYWSGIPVPSHRRKSAVLLAEWATKHAPGGLGTVFAHSYGGEIAARTIIGGTPIKELVLLSSIVNGRVVAALDRCAKVVDVRLRLDPVLSIAGSAQRLPPHDHVRTVLFRRWNLDHSATHNPGSWAREDVVTRGGI